MNPRAAASLFNLNHHPNLNAPNHVQSSSGTSSRVAQARHRRSHPPRIQCVGYRLDLRQRRGLYRRFFAVRRRLRQHPSECRSKRGIAVLTEQRARIQGLLAKSVVLNTRLPCASWWTTPRARQSRHADHRRIGQASPHRQHPQRRRKRVKRPAADESPSANH